MNSVARIRLVKTENPSACAMVNWSVCGKSGTALFPVVPSCLSELGAVYPVIHSRIRLSTPYT
jgi:hypothetical protein